MGRLLVLVLIVVGVVWLVKRALRSDEQEIAQKPPVQGDLVPCARCGVNLPRAEAREAAGALYCSDEHARLGKA
ncbi:MAG: PP0621 family protein [Clostridia bacterium]